MATGERQWVVDVRNRLKDVDLSAEMGQWGKHSIYTVPSCIKDLHPKAYKPQVVSFGPFHHGEEPLQPMEEHKQRALMHFLSRPNIPFLFDDLMAAMCEVVQPLQDAYEKLDEVFSDKDRFVELMIRDGCFMLEVIREMTREITDQSSDYASNDPIFNNKGSYAEPYIRRDMLMIENQLPLLVLEKLIAVETGKPMDQIEDKINELVLKFLPISPPHVAGLGRGLHPLDVLRKSMLQSPSPILPPPQMDEIIRSAVELYETDIHFIQSTLQRPSPTLPTPQWDEIIRSAVELHAAGIRFKESKNESQCHIQFSGGVLCLPSIIVDDFTEYMFLNIMAFERLHFGAGKGVTSYAVFMDSMIDSAEDVSLLISQGIIKWAGVGSDEAAAKLFNGLSKDVALDPESSLNDVHHQVREYCRKPWNKWRANLIHTYFRSPWTLLSLVAAILLLVLTIMQTVYTVMSYYQSKSSQP